MFKFKGKANKVGMIDLNKRGYDKLVRLKEKGLYNKCRYRNNTLIAGESEIYIKDSKTKKENEKKIFEVMSQYVDFTDFKNNFVGGHINFHTKFDKKYDSKVSLVENVSYYDIKKEFTKLATAEQLTEINILENELKMKAEAEVFEDLKAFDDSVFEYYKEDTIQEEVEEELILIDNSKKDDEEIVSVDYKAFSSKIDYAKYKVKQLCELSSYIDNDLEASAIDIMIKEFKNLEFVANDICGLKIDKDNIVNQLSDNLLITLDAEQTIKLEKVISVLQDKGE